MPTQISFIIPHKGRIQLLIQTIDSIIQQEFDLSLIEIIIVTQNSDLEVSSLNLQEFVNVKILKRPSSDTISALRNFGVSHSSGEYLAFLDADICLFPNWISSVLNELKNSEYILISACQANSANAPPIERIRTALSNAELDTEVNFLPGRNLFLRKTDFYQTEGFPEHLITCEDYYFTDQLHHIGKLFYTSKSEYVHLGEDRIFSEMFKKEIWRGQSNLLSIKGRKIPLREIPSFIVPLAVMILFLLGVIFLFSGNIILGLVSISLLMVMILSYVFRLLKLVKRGVKPLHILKFYLYYFPARAFGTIAGLFQSLQSEK